MVCKGAAFWAADPVIALMRDSFANEETTLPVVAMIVAIAGQCQCLFESAWVASETLLAGTSYCVFFHILISFAANWRMRNLKLPDVLYSQILIHTHCSPSRGTKHPRSYWDCYLCAWGNGVVNKVLSRSINCWLKTIFNPLVVLARASQNSERFALGSNLQLYPNLDLLTLTYELLRIDLGWMVYKTLMLGSHRSWRSQTETDEVNCIFCKLRRQGTILKDPLIRAFQNPWILIN